jgi:hypothetical protein
MSYRSGCGRSGDHAEQHPTGPTGTDAKLDRFVEISVLKLAPQRRLGGQRTGPRMTRDIIEGFRPGALVHSRLPPRASPAGPDK